MAIVQIEDLTGQAEAVVFPKNPLSALASIFRADVRLMVWGKVDRRDERGAVHH